MSHRVSTRPFRRDDVPALFELFRGTVHRVNSRDYSPEQVAAWAPPETNPARWETLASRFAVVAEVGGDVAGFADLEPDGHVDRFFVHADHQGRGVGTAMMAAILSEAGRLRVPRLFAEVSITARPFFERHGFDVLAEQQVVVRGVSLTNFRMERHLGTG
ncbi:acetyltransferase : Glr3142 protein OS=Gloeobacter violaceus (strain PCC 7421) GN=glr3142 PE=4 SV=1: Acetyltransf_10 [Gemmataceae bacterium]|nr:acetyltransferase : Glr3142 protein OS=Gloeobacter violaceus (strain PCC 7421) GN=glr3142 PE=4 SV=1: Acetyltransf_10 [Gemmataceae bacterium]VTT98997.1 acetyltransferase : Glr3142 protein OS=Gloeobacter violaceus (strain PCC 7421) GN=glr3142 PE=4 SV=1: Acetyltransf_10 [Gemmataceae bacterium]